MEQSATIWNAWNGKASCENVESVHGEISSENGEHYSSGTCNTRYYMLMILHVIAWHAMEKGDI